VRRRWTVLVVLAAVLGGIGAVAALRVRGDHVARRPVPLDIPAAEQLARQACALATTFEDQVKANASSRQVLATADAMRASANDAADRDPRWRSLAGGTDALRLAMRKDDAAAARIGIDVVRAQCADLS
jgi:hypothetical protein